MLYIIVLALLGASDAYKILLLFPVPGKSHSILGEAYVRHLTQAGHNVTYITPLPLTHPPPNLRQIDVSTKKEILLENLFDVRKFMYRELDLQEIQLMFPVMREVLDNTLQHAAMQKLLHDTTEQYDAVVVEWLFTELGAGLAAVFQCPFIWSTSTEPHSLILSLIDEDQNPSYSVNIWDRNSSLDFYDRVQNLWSLLKLKYYKWKDQGIDNEIYINRYKSAVEARGFKLPPFQEVAYNASLMLGNSHISSGEAVKLPQAYKTIGGYHVKDKIEPLPENLQTIMDAAHHGVIYFSLGTMLKSSAMPNNTRQEIIDFFGTLQATVVWKYENKIQNLPKNVHVMQWAPQPSILAHPKTVLFITHGGILSLYEAMNFGVPTIGIPMFADQFSNTNRAVNNGFGKRFNLGQEPLTNFFEYIKDMIDNPKYRRCAKEYSFIYHDRPVSPGAELVHWVEHVVKTRGALHLRSPALMVPWYQKLYLDLLALIIILILMIVYVALHLSKRMFRKSLTRRKVD